MKQPVRYMSAITQVYVNYSPECTYRSVLKIMGQVKVCNYGDVKPGDCVPTIYPKDSSVEAVYLFNGARSDFQGNEKSDFDTLFKVHIRMRNYKVGVKREEL
jgi:hypothetical protein